jgi:hypothetical protein
MAAPKAASKDRKSGFRGLGALVTAPGIAGSTKRKNPVLPIASAAPAAAPAKPQPAPSRSFGGINARKSAPVRGKPRYLGLIMTAVLLLVLALIAAWSTSLAFRDEGQTGTETATAPDAPTDELPAPEDEMLADMQDPEALAADRALSEGETGSAVTTAAPDAPLPVTTDGTPAPVPSEDKQDEIFLAAMDQAPAAPDPLSLPEPDARGDPQPVRSCRPRAPKACVQQRRRFRVRTRPPCCQKLWQPINPSLRTLPFRSSAPRRAPRAWRRWRQTTPHSRQRPTAGLPACAPKPAPLQLLPPEMPPAPPRPPPV